MIKRYSNLSFLFFLPGTVSLVAGFILMDKHKLLEPMGVLSLSLLIG